MPPSSAPQQTIPQPSWRNRIVAHEDVAPDQLLANPRNWRIHPRAQRAALAGLLREVGWVQEVIVNRRTGFVVDGHLRVALALAEGQPRVPVKYVELTEAEEALVLATLDPLAALAQTDATQVDALLREVHTAEADVQALLTELARPSSAPSGGEGPVQTTSPEAAYRPRCEVMVECRTEQEMEALFNRLTQEGYRCRVLML